MHSAAPTQTSAAQRFKRTFESQQLGIVFALIALIIILGIVSPVFLSPRNLRNVLQQVSTLGILSMGMTVLMISGGIDLSVGSCISVVAVIVGMMIKAHYPPELAMVVGLLIGCGIGLINGLLAAYTRAHPFILTLGTMTLFQGVAVYHHQGLPDHRPGQTIRVDRQRAGVGCPCDRPPLLLVMLVC